MTFNEDEKSRNTWTQKRNCYRSNNPFFTQEKSQQLLHYWDLKLIRLPALHLDAKKKTTVFHDNPLNNILKFLFFLAGYLALQQYHQHLLQSYERVTHLFIRSRMRSKQNQQLIFQLYSSALPDYQSTMKYLKTLYSRMK